VIGPAPILAAVTAMFHVALYVFIRNTAARLPLFFGAAFLGALAGDALGSRLGGDPFGIGDFHLLWASLGAWLGIGVLAVLGVLGPERLPEPGPRS
jgi:hypothetical protein